MKLVYVASKLSDPVSTKYLDNVRRNILLGNLVRDLGAVPFIPSLDLLSCVAVGSIDLDVLRNECIEVMKRCDAVFFDSDWKNSKGCLVEHEEAKKHNIPCFEYIDDLQKWLQDFKKT